MMIAEVLESSVFSARMPGSRSLSSSGRRAISRMVYSCRPTSPRMENISASEKANMYLPKSPGPSRRARKRKKRKPMAARTNCEELSRTALSGTRLFVVNSFPD